MTGRVLPLFGWTREGRTALAALVGTASLLLAGLVAWEPWVAAGLVLGGALLIVTLSRPLVILGLMLAFGPIDLRALTGGYKGLFESLGGIDMNGIRLIGLTLSFAAIALIDRDVVREAFSRYGRWYLVFLIYAAGTLVLSTAPIDGARLLLKLAYPFMTFIVVLGIVETHEDLEKLTLWMLGGAAVITVLLNPFYVLAGGYEIDFGGRIRIMGVGQHENPFSFYLLTVILLCFTRYSLRGHQYRYLVLAGVCAVWMVLTLTRITFLATCAGLLGLAFYTAIVERKYRPLVVGSIVLGGIGFALAPMVLERTLGYVATFGELVYYIGHPIQLYEAINWQGREIFWPLLFGFYLESPLVGLGLGSSTAILLEHFPPEWGTVPHNEYLRLLVEAGIVGVILFALAISIWWFAMIRMGRSDVPLAREFALAGAAAIVAWAFIAITDNPFDYYSPFTQYIGFLCGASLAAARIGAEGGRG